MAPKRRTARSITQTRWSPTRKARCLWCIARSWRPSRRGRCRRWAGRPSAGMRLDRLVVGLGAGGLALYAARLRNPVLTWGATPTEASARLPGDELLEGADGVAT